MTLDTSPQGSSDKERQPLVFLPEKDNVFFNGQTGGPLEFQIKEISYRFQDWLEPC